MGLWKAGESVVLSPAATERPPQSNLVLFLWPAELYASTRSILQSRETGEAPAKLIMCLSLSAFLVETSTPFPWGTCYLMLSHQCWFAWSTPAHLHSWLQTHTNKKRWNGKAALLQSNASFLAQIMEIISFFPGVCLHPSPTPASGTHLLMSSSPSRLIVQLPPLIHRGTLQEPQEGSENADSTEFHTIFLPRHTSIW